MKLYISTLFLFFCVVSNSASQDLNDFIRRSSANQESKNYALAAEICNKALLLGKDYRLYLILADAQYNMGNSDNAISSYEMASISNPGAGDLGLAAIYAERGDSQKAVSYLENHLRSPYKKAESEIMLNKHFSSIQPSMEWKNLWKRSWYTELEKGLSEALYLIENKRIEELEGLEQHLLPLYREEAAMKYLQGLVKMAYRDLKGAQADFRASIESGFSSPEAYYYFIDVLIEDRNYFEAVNVCDKAMSTYPNETGYLLKKADANRRVGDREKAVADINIYLELFPGSEEGLSLAGRIMSEKRSYTEALKYYSKSIDLYPGNADHYIDRADVYSRTGTWQFAVMDYSMALDLRPADGNVYYRKGMALLKIGRHDDACRDFRMALKYGNKKAASEISRNCIR